MAKVIHTIDSEAFNTTKGYQQCSMCPVSGMQYTENCETYFKYLFGNGCDEICVKTKPDYALKVKLGDSTEKKVNETRRKCRLNFLNLKREQVRAAMKEAGYSEDEIKTALHHNHKSLKIGYDAGMQCADQNPL